MSRYQDSDLIYVEGKGTCLPISHPTITGADPRVQPDARDEAILSERVAALDARQGHRVGDFVEFADGTVRRISHVWEGVNDDGSDSVQTSDGGSYYLGRGYVSMSGGLYLGVSSTTLTPADEARMGGVWFFHHDYHRASNGVTALVPFRVFSCSQEATR